MNKEEYIQKYITCYNHMMDIMVMVKDFIYPGEYTFERIDEKWPVEKKIAFIKRDLESVKFEKEVPKQFVDNLEYYFPDEELDLEGVAPYIEEYWENELVSMKKRLKEKYLPFIKLMAINDYKDANMDADYTDEEAWEALLGDQREVEDIENRVKDVIWTLNDNGKEDIVDNFLQDHYKLNNLEFNRYMKGINNNETSIVRIRENKNEIGANFKVFDKYFEDIFGQDEAIERIRKTLLRSILFYNAEDLEDKVSSPQQGPLATFMFYGPTGTGKTETAKRMAKFVYGNANKMLILDMNSYKDSKVSASALKGHPEGYVDSGKGTDFTRFLQNNDKGIIVLDEFEKSANEVRELFMTMLDEGKFKDALGNTYDLSGYIFVATTNVSKVFEQKKSRPIGFTSYTEKQIEKDDESRIRDELRGIFTAPIMNRFNNIIGFNEIKKKDAIDICDSLINKLIAKFESKKFNGITPKIKIDNKEEIIELILTESNFKKDGVRSLKNVINDLIGSQILEEIVNGKEKMIVRAEDDKIVVHTRNSLVESKRNKTV